MIHRPGYGIRCGLGVDMRFHSVWQIDLVAFADSKDGIGAEVSRYIGERQGRQVLCNYRARMIDPGRPAGSQPASRVADEIGMAIKEIKMVAGGTMGRHLQRKGVTR